MDTELTQNLMKLGGKSNSEPGAEVVKEQEGVAWGPQMTEV